MRRIISAALPAESLLPSAAFRSGGLFLCTVGPPVTVGEATASCGAGSVESGVRADVACPPMSGFWARFSRRRRPLPS